MNVMYTGTAQNKIKYLESRIVALNEFIEKKQHRIKVVQKTISRYNDEIVKLKNLT